MLTPDATRTANGAALPGGWALRVITGERTELRPLPLRGVVIVGRDPGADVPIEDAQASRLHARVLSDGAAVSVVDLGSKNGSALNGAPLGVEPQRVAVGDVLRCGGTLIIFEAAVALGVAVEDGAGEDGALHIELPRGRWSVAEPAMKALVAVATRLAMSPLPVLILGETGTGKEGLASLIHARSPRAGEAFVALNCAALPPDLVESELFGHQRGAFTGAVRDKAGLFEAAHRGTLFLDEIGDLAPAAQAKLLRALDGGYIRRLGDAVDRRVDVRVVAATHRSLELGVAEGRFREDLSFRLGGAVLRVPPLRDRPRDVALLATALLAAEAPGLRLAPATMAALQRYDWPGNVRELRNAMAFVAATSDGPTVEVGALPPSVRGIGQPHGGQSLDERVGALERSQILEALAASGGNQTQAAARLGMARRTFLRRLKQYGIPGRRGD